MPSLSDSVQFLKGVGPRRAEDFARLGVTTVRDLLYTFPRRISDRTNFVTIAEAIQAPGIEISLRVRVLETSSRRIRRGKHLTSVVFEDDTGVIEGLWFNSPWVLEQFSGEDVLLFGKVTLKGKKAQIIHPRMELVPAGSFTGKQVGRMVPIYPQTGLLTQAAWLRIMGPALDQYLPILPELYPEEFLEKRQLMGRAEAIRNLHFPESAARKAKARERLVYDECLVMQLGIALRRYCQIDTHPGRVFKITGKIEKHIRALFPFKLTPGQQRAVAEIIKDMQAPHPMHRLLQGDVGCGKTAVAFYAILAAVANGAQAAIMAPTEILARQHARTFGNFLERSRKSRVRIGLLVGGMKKTERQTLLAAVRGGAVDVLIATHAAIQKEVTFNDLGLVVIDEQHKFGVAQRAALRQKGTRPDVLVMTATPIPRSLALTLYGDLDVSTIDSLPPGRKTVKTLAPESSAWPKICDFLRREFTAGHQAFIICPLVEENEDLDLKSAVAEYERLSREEFSSFRLGLLHGRIKREQQRKVMTAFRRGRLDALVSTVVVEVGVDVPNATILVVLHAERFGLAQLHQLRGRIGRGSRQGYCILVSDATTPIARERLEIMVKESDGFRIAEADLRLRGEGEFLGTRQHGHAFKLASIIDDYPVLRRARDDARRLLKSDPMLSRPSHRAIREEVVFELGDRLELAGTG